MPLRRPSVEELEEIARAEGLSLSRSDVAEYATVVELVLERLERVRSMPAPSAPPADVGYPRGASYRPQRDEDPYNVWINRCRVSGADSGPLDDVTVGLKDSIALAGVELTCGSRLLEGYVPTIDATVVTRLLEAGATIEGKLNMESFAASGTGDLSDFGPVLNPHSKDHLAGGSSSGSGAAPAAGEVDVALGTDQGGSCRIPASCCGVVGLKPTTGLVPYTGTFPADPTLDHVGPLARTVEEVARTLEVIAGPDGLDPRQPADLEVGAYSASLSGDADHLEIAVLDEGFGHPESVDAVDETVHDALSAFEEAGVETHDVSVPVHRDAIALWTVIRYYGALQVHRQDGIGSMLDGWYDTGLAEAFGKFRRSRARDFPPTIKTMTLAMAYLDRAYGAGLYGKAQNLTAPLGEAYDEALGDADLLAMPTIPMTPFEVDEDLGPIERAGRSTPVPKNTCPFDITGHPSISVPCGTVDGLPIGLMFVASRMDEETLLRAADAFERTVDWQSR